jgi:hypothetical protein
MGEICTRISEKIKEVKEVSLVSEPANKRARITRITDEVGILRDVMTWRTVPEEISNSTKTEKTEG